MTRVRRVMGMIRVIRMTKVMKVTRATWVTRLRDKSGQGCSRVEQGCNNL